MKIQSVTYKTSIVEEMKSFYSGTLDLTLSHQTADSFTVKIGDTHVTFEQADIEKPHYHYAIRIPSGKLKPAKEWLESRTTLVTHKSGHQVINFRKINSRSIYFFDPEYNLLEFIDRKELGDYADGPFTTRDIRAVAEVGLPVKDLEGSVNLMSKELSEKPIVEGDGPLTPVGDYEGAFILAREHEDWFMTDNPALIRPIIVEVSSENGNDFEFDNHPYKILVNNESRNNN